MGSHVVMQRATAEAVEPSELRAGDEREEARKLHADQGSAVPCMISTEGDPVQAGRDVDHAAGTVCP
jgi:hypothetical protein